MKQIFPVLCKRSILPSLTIHRIKCSHLYSEYRNEGKEKAGSGKKEIIRQTWLGLGTNKRRAE
jgi:hypothetical protein